MDKELIFIENAPRIPKNWNYENSVKKIRQTVFRWKNLTTELVEELWIAREILSNPGARNDLKEGNTWQEYCNEIGVDRSTIHRWINRFFNPVANATRLDSSELPKEKFTIFYVDPPWQFDNSGFEQSAASKYPTMSTQEISELPVKNCVQENSVLFMWATNAMLQDALIVMDIWGFHYKTNLVWIKDKAPGIGWFTKSKHELLLIGVNGTGLHPQEKPNSWFEGKVTRHSKKPESVYEIIEKMYPNQKYIELFARNSRKNWTSWGNEIKND